MYYISAFAGLLQDSVSEDRRLGEVARVLLLMFYDAVTGVVGSCCSGWEDVQHEVGVRLSVFMSGSLYFGLAGCATMCFSLPISESPLGSRAIMWIGACYC